MRKPKYKWIYDENDYQRYYDVSIGNDYLCVFENKWHPGVWF